MLLSDEEIEACALQNMGDTHNAVRAIEAAILAKLASAELPTTVWVDVPHFTFTADQLRQAHAQGFAAGAAAQLAEKPLAYFYHDASCPEMANPLLHSTLLLHADERNSNLKNETPLYTRREA